MRIAIRHQLTLTPLPGTGHLVLQMLLSAKNSPSQTVEDWTLEAPGMENAARFEDAYGNRVHLVNQNRPAGPLVVTVNGIVDTQDKHGVLGKPAGEPVPALFKRVTPLTRVPVTLYSRFRGAKESRLDVLHGLMLRVSEVLTAPPAQPQQQTQSALGQTQSQGGQSQSQGAAVVDEPAEPASVSDTPPASDAQGHEVVARLPRPPATDYAHSFVGAARALNIPARYVTGYIVGDEDHPAAFHAWAEAFDEKLGWIGFDPMLELCPTDRHVRLAVGLDSLSAAPMRCVPAGDGVPQEVISIEQI